MRIGELAQIAGVTPRTIRYYENLGQITATQKLPKYIYSSLKQ